MPSASNLGPRPVTCYGCGKDFFAGNSLDEMEKQYRKDFPDMLEEAADEICNDCYQEIMDLLKRLDS